MGNMTKGQEKRMEWLAAENASRKWVMLDRKFDYDHARFLFEDGYRAAHTDAQVLVDALEMAKFTMNAFIEKIPAQDLVTQDLMMIEVKRYGKALAKWKGEG